MQCIFTLSRSASFLLPNCIRKPLKRNWQIHDRSFAKMVGRLQLLRCLACACFPAPYTQRMHSGSYVRWCILKSHSRIFANRSEDDSGMLIQIYAPALQHFRNRVSILKFRTASMKPDMDLGVFAAWLLFFFARCMSRDMRFARIMISERPERAPRCWLVTSV